MTKEEIRIEADKYNRSLSRHPTSVQELTEVLVEFAERMQLLQQTPCKTHVCHHCGGVDGHTIECTAWCGKTVTV